MADEIITVAEIKNLIKEEEIKPSDLFDNDALATDPFVKGYVADEKKMASSGEYAHRKRTDTKFDDEREKWEKKEKDQAKVIKDLKVKDAKRDAIDLFGKKIKERKLDEKLTKFIESKQGNFVPEDTEKLDKEVDSFMDDTVKEFKETAEILGIKTEEIKEETKPGSPPGSEEEGDDQSFIPE